MKKNAKKAIALLLMLTMILGSAVMAVPENGIPALFKAQAASVVKSGKCGKTMTWTLDNEGTLTISGSGSMYDYGYGTSNGDSPWWFTEIRRVVFDGSIKSIGQQAFYDVFGLSSIEIPDSIEKIGAGAFFECRNLESVYIYNPDCVIERGKMLDSCYAWTFTGSDDFDFTMYGYTNSTAETYYENNLKGVSCGYGHKAYFIPLGDQAFHPRTVTLFNFNDVNYNFKNYDEYYTLQDYVNVYGNTEKTYSRFYNDSKNDSKQTSDYLATVTSKGVCYGMSTSSLLLQKCMSPSYFNNSSRVHDIQKQYTSSQAKSYTALKFIGYMQLTQFTKSTYKVFDEHCYANNKFADESDLIYAKPEYRHPLRLEALMKNLLSGKPMVIGISKKSAHAVLPYKITVLNDHEARIYVYDCEWPEDSERYISVWRSPDGNGGYSEHFENWYYDGGGRRADGSVYTSPYGNEFKDSYILYVDYSNIKSSWDNMGRLFLDESGDNDMSLVSVSGDADIALQDGSYISVRDGRVTHNGIPGALLIDDEGFTLDDDETQNSGRAAMYLPTAQYIVTNMGSEPADVLVSDDHSSVNVAVPEGAGASISVDDNSDNFFTLNIPEYGYHVGNIDFRIRYENANVIGMDTVKVLGDADEGTVSVTANQSGVRVDGMNSGVVSAKVEDRGAELNHFSTYRGDDASVLIHAGSDDIFIDEMTDSGLYDHSLSRESLYPLAAELKIDSSDLKMYIGRTKSVRADLLPYNCEDIYTGLNWFSSNENVATVSQDGLITAVGEGTAQIFCTVEESNLSGAELADSITVSVSRSLAAPGSPKAVSNGYASNKLTWSKVSGASGYVIYSSDAKNGTYKAVKTITSGSTLTFTHTKLTCGKAYYYKVRAFRNIDGLKVYGSYSSIVGAKPIPGNVTLTAKKASATSAKLTWKKVAGASGYQVFRSTSKTGTYKLIKTTTGTSYTDKGLAKGKTYWYKVRAYRNVSGKKIAGKCALKSVSLK